MHTSIFRKLRILILAVAVLIVGSIAILSPRALAGEGDTEVTIIGITDFHGHIENGPYLATGINEARATNPNNVLVGCGDLVGASSFASACQDDKPAFEELKAMGLEVTATGNHDFDSGIEYFDTFIVPNMKPAQYVVCNMEGSDLTGTEPYWIKEFNGKRVAFIGAVTSELPSLVSPSGLGNCKVSEPVAALNKVADQLRDGNAENGEADAVVVICHEDGHKLIGLNSNVNAVLSGHTHLEEQGMLKITVL